uniref:Uncharacterized protein n=1 Tax=Tetranychus urticae TaxID=32264 RepID=A0A158P4N9_TETUR
MTDFVIYPNIDLRKIHAPDKKWLKFAYIGDDYASSVDVSPDDSLDLIIDKLNTAMMKNLTKIRPSWNFDRYPKFVCENGKTVFYAGLLTTTVDKYAKIGLSVDGPVDLIKSKYKNDYGIDLEEIGTLSTESQFMRTDKNWIYYYKNRLIDEIRTDYSTNGEQTDKYKAISSIVVVPQFSDGKLLEYLGFSPSGDALINAIDSYKQEVVVTTPLYHKNNVNLMYVYTDIIRDHTVGGTKAPVLRAVPLTTGIYQGIGYCTFEHRIYYPVRKNHIENIAIICLDDTGEQIKFANIGRVFVSLDFRKKN